MVTEEGRGFLDVKGGGADVTSEDIGGGADVAGGDYGFEGLPAPKEFLVGDEGWGEFVEVVKWDRRLSSGATR